MEKVQTVVSEKSAKQPVVLDTSRQIAEAELAFPSVAGAKIDRKDISRCIHIWAKFYRQGGSQSDLRELCVPPAPWHVKD
ncbi:hypothetical protein [Noviherbaspirillum humi]|uniref:hypothetical protein n=1 Tax=Noviherbaspirillum humi TaxID=1688639 RepID=UPI0011608A76|nr:hypothetical protein [Noviherbaspirillum humi]